MGEAGASGLSPAAGGLFCPADAKPRCGWCSADPVYMVYHDTEWGVPSRCEKHLFEMLSLEGFQAGLSWLTILKKRENFREAFCDWEVERVARLTDAGLQRLRGNSGIVRNRSKILTTVQNARAFLRVQAECGSFADYLWKFTGGKIIRMEPRRQNWREVPASTTLAECISKDLKERGFGYCGPVIVYSYLQSVGIVDDHIAGCWCGGG